LTYDRMRPLSFVVLGLVGVSLVLVLFSNR
jgi:hypothetical protein